MLVKAKGPAIAGHLGRPLSASYNENCLIQQVTRHFRIKYQITRQVRQIPPLFEEEDIFTKKSAKY
jgi:hypothetical protein